MARPIIALLTDFGTRDPYVGAMKGVVLSICPDATLVDLTHDIPPYDVREGARALAGCYAFYPAGTIFVAVVDPGVGSARRALAIDAGRFSLVGPDNGIFTEVLARHPSRCVVEISNRRYQRPTVSRTFEGRDRFAPAAAWLASGMEVAGLGPRVDDIVRLERAVADVSADGVSGEVEAVDRFGNLISNLERPALEMLMRDGPIDVRLGEHQIARLVATYAEAAPGEACALFGSTDHLEIAVNGASATGHFGAGTGTRVTVRRRRAL